MNKVILTGRITRDPEARFTSNGVANVSFSLAVERPYRDQSGQRQADFINCVAWRTQADFISRFVKKGNMLCIEGSIQTRQYQGQDGQTRYVTEVLVDQVENLTPRDPNQAPSQQTYQQPQQYQKGYNNPSYGAQQQYAPRQNQGYQSQQPQQKPAESVQQAFNVDVNDDDLPF